MMFKCKFHMIFAAARNKEFVLKLKKYWKPWLDWNINRLKFSLTGLTFEAREIANKWKLIIRPNFSLAIGHVIMSYMCVSNGQLPPPCVTKLVAYHFRRKILVCFLFVIQRILASHMSRYIMIHKYWTVRVVKFINLIG